MPKSIFIDSELRTIKVIKVNDLEDQKKVLGGDIENAFFINHDDGCTTYFLRNYKSTIEKNKHEKKVDGFLIHNRFYFIKNCLVTTYDSKEKIIDIKLSIPEIEKIVTFVGLSKAY